MTLRLMPAAALMLALTACGSSTPSTAQPKDTSKRPFSVTEVATFDSPWAMAFLPGSGVPLTNTALVTEKSGRLWLVNVSNGAKQQVAGVPRVQVDSQGGLADVVVHPDFAGNQRVYLSYSEPGPNSTSGAAIGYGRLVMGQGQPRIDGFRVIWRQQPKVTGGAHYSQRIVFAPDGTMFVSSGERMKMTPAQDLGSDLGKILHLTAEGQPVPGGPWANRGGRAASYWTMGHRNVLGLAFAPDGRLWETEMGPRGGDEVNLIVRGKNYGWPEASYGTHYDGRDIPDDHKSRGFEEPKIWWNPSVSPGSLLIYTGDLFPQWKGDALIGALSGQAFIRVDIDGDRARKADQWNMGNRIRAVDQGLRGEVYLLEDGENGPAQLLRMEPRR
jgi:glucose/arabinose dehydrogenase